MKKLMIAAVVAALTLGSYADEKAEMVQDIAAADIQAEFDEPDGAAIKLNPDGTFCIFARGTGTYDIDDPDDVNDAKKEAVLKAKSALAKFMNEKLSTEEGLSEASKKVKNTTIEGDQQTTSVSKESVKETSTVIKNNADALLKGVITLKMQKIARKGTSGEVQATVGVSSKTLKAVIGLVYGIDAVPDQGTTKSNRPNATRQGNPNAPSNNRGWTQKSTSDL